MYDVLIQNGRIIDGAGSPWFNADVGVLGDTISVIGDCREEDARVNIDARGKCVCPGFIDAHTHSDLALFEDPAPDCKLRQGVTTEVTGNCGKSPAPVDEGNRAALKDYVGVMPGIDRLEWRGFDQFLDLVEQKSRHCTNVLTLVGHGTLRIAAMGFKPDPPSLREMDKMKALLVGAMEAGALGMSSGLVYAPGIYATTEELVELAKVLPHYGGIYFSHIRGESETLFDAVEEAIRIGREAGVSVHIAHHKTIGKHVWGRTRETLAMFDQARKDGVDVTADAYPYIAGNCALHALLPPWVLEGGIPSALKTINDAANQKRIEKEMLEGLPGWAAGFKGIGWDGIMISMSREPEIQGMRIDEIAKERGIDPFQCFIDILLKDEGITRIIKFQASEEDFIRVLGHPAVMIGSDSTITVGHPHPRNYGNFPRVLSRFVRDKKVISLETAVQKMTSLPAMRCRLSDRGLLRPGMKADLVVFDPNTVEDRATFTDPRQYPEGISWVLVNGAVAVKNGETVNRKAGLLLRHQWNSKSR